jgi:hypothetical protein
MCIAYYRCKKNSNSVSSSHISRMHLRRLSNLTVGVSSPHFIILLTTSSRALLTYKQISLSLSLYSPTMKSFQAVIIAAIVASSVAINEPVASPSAAIERELAEYERQLGTDITGTPTGMPPRPTPVSLLFISLVASEEVGADAEHL